MSVHKRILKCNMYAYCCVHNLIKMWCISASRFCSIMWFWILSLVYFLIPHTNLICTVCSYNTIVLHRSASCYSRNEIRAKNLFNVADCKMHWQKSGDYLCVNVNRYSKIIRKEKNEVKYSVSPAVSWNKKKNISSTFQFCNICYHENRQMNFIIDSSSECDWGL
jgi:hypothetical protein